MLDGLYSIAVPVLFWAGLLYGIYMSVASSETSFLGNETLTQFFAVVVLLFLLGLIHGLLGLPFFFSKTVEFTLILAVFSLIIAGSLYRKKMKRKKMIQDDPNVKQCKKCGAVIERLYVRCPDCNAEFKDKN